MDGNGTIELDEFGHMFLLKATFSEIDTDKSGQLDEHELATLFERLGKPVSVRAPDPILCSGRTFFSFVFWQSVTLIELVGLTDWQRVGGHTGEHDEAPRRGWQWDNRHRGVHQDRKCVPLARALGPCVDDLSDRRPQ